MKKYIISILIGLLSATGILTGLLNQTNQDSINAVKNEENAAIEDSSIEELETDDHISDDTNIEIAIESAEENVENIEKTNVDKFAEEITEETIVDINIDDNDKGNDETIVKVEEKETEVKATAPSTEKKQEQEKSTKEKEIKIDSNKEAKSFFNELENCDENTVYSKVIINGKEYKDYDAETLLNNLVKQYGVNLNKINNKGENKGNDGNKENPKQENEPDNTVPKETEAKDPQPSKNNYAEQVLQLVNKERQAAGLSALSMDSKLKAAADKRAVETVSKFSHQRLNGSNFDTVLDEYGVKFNSAGENIAYGQPTPKSVVNAWMNSAGHRANILDSRFNKIGVGVHEQNGVIYWTQLFTN